MNRSRLSKIALSILFMSSLLSCEDHDAKSDDSNRQLDSLSTELTQQRHMNDSLTALLAKGELASNYPVLFGKRFDTIKDPEAYVKQALEKQPEKIPMKPVVGGKMNFRAVEVISEDWVLATYDDGHVQGRSIYQYSFEPDGSLNFEIIASTSSQ